MSVKKSHMHMQWGPTKQENGPRFLPLYYSIALSRTKCVLLDFMDFWGQLYTALHW
jgi:hypothetical protein